VGDCRIFASGTSRSHTRPGTPPTADVGLDLSSFNLLQPWQQQVVAQSGDQTARFAHSGSDDSVEEVGPSGPVSDRFQKSMQTINLWKAQQEAKIERGPVSSQVSASMGLSSARTSRDLGGSDPLVSKFATTSSGRSAKEPQRRPETNQENQRDEAGKLKPESSKNLFAGVSNIFSTLGGGGGGGVSEEEVIV
jgi:hypothetical protein